MKLILTRRSVIEGAAGLGIWLITPATTSASPDDSSLKVDPRPYFDHVKRVIEAMRLTGYPLSPEHESQILSFAKFPSAENVARAERILDRYTLVRTRLDERGVGDSFAGDAKRELLEQGWRGFLIRVHNPFGRRAQLRLVSPSATAEGELRTSVHYRSDTPNVMLVATPADVARLWLGYEFFTRAPLHPELSGLQTEYVLLQLYSRDHGRTTASLAFHTADAPMNSGWSGESTRIEMTFDCLPARDVTLDIKDWDGAGATASLIIRDAFKRLYPAPAHRLEPDFGFHPQVYRADGESVRLPTGRYAITVWRGPEYLKKTHDLTIGDSDTSPRFLARLERWIDPSALGWYPGDTHLHSETSDYGEVPTASMGVTPETMLRHVRGEALALGSVLLWRHAYYYQKQFLTGRVHEPTYTLPHAQLQEAGRVSLKPKATPRDRESMIRYDVEQAGFPSRYFGHPVLLGLKNHDYPGVGSLDEWPSWNLPVLKWARAQGAVVGYAHCGLGMAVRSRELPNYQIPALDSIGANEYLVDVAHGVVDFVSEGESYPAAALNFWYHVLNCGFRTPMVGETDFPAFSAERVGTLRTYVGLDDPPRGDAGFGAWLQGIKRGRLYFGDGRSHFIDYRVQGQQVDEADPELAKPGTVTVTARVAARLEETPVSADDDHNTPVYSYWHLERARIGKTRTVPLEIIVNGRPVARHEIPADGQLRDFSAQVELQHSSWVALRILPSGHTAPIFATVARQPVRASRRSAQWCLDCIDVLWKGKGHLIRTSEREEAARAFEHAREVFRRIKSECSQD